MSGDFRLGSWVVRPSLSTVSRDNRTIHLEPKIVEVLVYLARHPDETVSKEHLIRAVWGNTFVTDDVLTRSISELRKALDDDAKEPRIILTIPRKGYRLIPQVEPVKLVQRKMSWRFLIASVLLCALLGLAIAYVSLHPSPHPIQSLAVLPLKNLSSDVTQDCLADAMTDAIIGRLSGIHGLRVISRTSVMQFKNSGQSLPEIANRLNVEAVIEGSVLRVGNRVRVSAQLI